MGIRPDILDDESSETNRVPARRVACSLSFALDLKSEFKRVFKNVLSILLGNTVGTGSIKISRTVLPGWDPGKNKLK